MKSCSVKGCDSPVWSRGFCSAHYQLYRRNGDPLLKRKNLHRKECAEVAASLGVKSVQTLPEYRSWKAMLNRTRTKTHKQYHRYGGRGIVVCQRWLSFKSFFEDMGRKPDPGFTIDRIRNNLGYRPSNCRWITRSDNSSRRRRSH